MTSTAHRIARLSRPANRFVGRRAELLALEGHLNAGHHLVTLVGPGGVGKTRLAREFTTRGGRAPAGMQLCHCDLSSTRSAEDIQECVVRALRISMTSVVPGADVGPEIGSWLARRGPLILVLDNFEQVAMHTHATVGVWHLVAPDVLFLVTSRAALRLPDEYVLDVAPLPLDALGDGPSDAVSLFIDRAKTALRRPIESEDELALAERIARRLDGLPLAIEMAASRLEVMTLYDLSQRLGERFVVLRDPSLSAGERHATLWHAIDWSWALLSRDEQQALAQSSVFATRFTLESAEAVLKLPGDTGAGAVLDAIQNLCRKSMLRVARDASGDGQRLVWYESVREYAARRLAESDDGAAARARHASHFLSMGEAWARGVDGEDGPALREQLAREFDNLAVVYDRALSEARTNGAERSRAAEQALRALFALSPVLATRGSPSVHIRWITSALEAAADTSAAHSVWAAHALFARGMSNSWLWNYEAAVRDITEAISIAESAGERALAARFGAYLGSIFELQGLHEQAADRLERSLAIGREENDGVVQGTALVFLGIQQMNRDDHVRARPLLQAALTVLHAAGHSELEELAHAHLGIMFADEDRLPEARACFQAAIALSRQLGLLRREAIVSGFLAVGYHLEGALDDAARAYEGTLTSLRDVGDRRFCAIYEGYLALLEAERGAIDSGLRHVRDAVENLRQGTDSRSLGGALAALSAICVCSGRHDEAEAVLTESAAVLCEHGGAAASAAFNAIVAAQSTLARSTERDRDPTDLAALERTLDAHAHVPWSDVRMVLRLARAAFAAARASYESWRIAADGSWFEPPQGSRVVLDHRPTLAAVLVALARQRTSDADTPMSIEALTEAGWPGEKLLADSAKNRVRVAITTLRKMGLEPLLKHGDGGYRLDPAIPLVTIPTARS